MTTTTSYGTWNNRVAPYSADFETYVMEAFGSEGTDGFDFDAIVTDYRDAINNALPDSVSLCGSEFIGPYESEDWAAAGYPTDEYDRLDVREIVEGIDFWEIANRHQTDTEDPMPLTIVSAATGDKVPGIEISDPASPISWDQLPAAARQWATEQGYGEDDSELLYVLQADEEVPSGFPSYQL